MVYRMRPIIACLAAAALILNMQVLPAPGEKEAAFDVYPGLSVTVPTSDPAEHVFSHRGGSGEAREHSFEAYDFAILCGSKYLELDVVLSSEGTIYVSHDFSPYRLTGEEREFQFLTDTEIDALRSPDGYPILQLESVFERYGKNVNYVIEFKRPKETADILIRLVKEYDLGDQVLVQCARADVIKKMDRDMPSLRFIYPAHDDIQFADALSMPYVDIIAVPYSIISMRWCSMAHEKGKLFAVWPLNDRDQITHAILIKNYF